MRIALLSDIHGNYEALEAVLDDIDKHNVDDIYCLGDVIGYGCSPVACLEKVAQRCRTTLIGNHEVVVLGLLGTEQLNSAAKQSLEWTASQISDHEMSLIEDFELQTEVEGALLVHASPWQPDMWHYILTMEQAAVAFENCDHHLCFFGHTHLPMIFSMRPDGKIRQQIGHDFLPDPSTRYLVNVGSVGQPRDNDPRACYAVYDSTEHEVLYHRVEYDIEGAQAKMTEAQAPSMLIERLKVGR